MKGMQIVFFVLVSFLLSCKHEGAMSSKSDQVLTGTFVSEFERNEFVGCQKALLLYWISNPKYLRSEMQRLGLSAQSPIEIIAHVSKEGGYGHMGAYRYEIEVKKVNGSFGVKDCSYPNVIFPAEGKLK